MSEGQGQQPIRKITTPLDMRRWDAEGLQMMTNAIDARLSLFKDLAERDARAELGRKPKSRLHRALRRLVDRIP